MPLRETYALSSVVPVSLLPNQAATASANGAGLDISKYTSQAIVLVSIGQSTGTSVTADLKLQESDDNSTWSDVAGAAITQVPEATASSVQAIVVNVDERKKYLRAVTTLGGTVTAVPLSATFLGLKQ